MWLAEVIIFIYLFFAIFKKLMGKLNSTQVHMDPDILFTYNPVLHPISTQLYPVLRLGTPTPPHFQLPSNTSPTGTKTLPFLLVGADHWPNCKGLAGETIPPC